MTTNETSRTQNMDNSIIAKWLKLEIFEELGKYLYKIERYETHERFAKTKKLIKLDFLHDRNQQKWIIDELIKRGYRVQITTTEHGTVVNIWHCDNHSEIRKEKDKIDDGSAFIEAVLELIKKENDTTGTC